MGSEGGIGRSEPWVSDCHGIGREMHGKEAVPGNNSLWFGDNEVYRFSVTRPVARSERFVACSSSDRTTKAPGKRVQSSEAAVYTVVDCKTVCDEFLHAVGQ